MLLLYLSTIDTPEDKSKFELLYETYRRLMKYIALDILNDETLAEDAVHDAFVKIIPHLQKFDDIACRKTKRYIVNVIKSVSIDMYNKIKRRKTTYTDNLELLADGSDVIFGNFELCEITEAIGSLPDEYREALIYRYVYNYSDKELADFLKINVGAARKRVERAKLKLASLLKED